MTWTTLPMLWIAVAVAIMRGRKGWL
jgi:hypothetical protein